MCLSLSFVKWHINLCGSFNAKKGWIGLGFRLWVFTIVFDHIRPDFGKKVAFFEASRCSLVWLISLVCWALWHINPYRPLNVKPRSYTLNLRFPNEYLVDNIPNESEPTNLHTIKWLQAPLHNTNNSTQHQQFVCT